MGMYINITSNGKTERSYVRKIYAILNDGGKIIDKPTKFVENLVCVVDNGTFAAAAYCYNEEEFLCFSDPQDVRMKTWIVWENVKKFAK